MSVTRHWAMPNRRTFSIKPIKELIAKYSLTPVFDVFQLGLETDVLANLKALTGESQQTVLLDPPYSPRQAKEVYGYIFKTFDAVQFNHRLRLIKDEIARVVRPGGHVISCGWNSNGLGIKRGFYKVEIRLIAHGGSHNDTIVVVERKYEDADYRTAET